jgi:hypothetical protein
VRRRRLTSLAAAAVVAVLSCSTAALADLTPTPSPTGLGLPLSVTLGGIRPLAPQPGDTLTVRGRLSNLSDETASGLTVQLLVSRTKIGSRGEFDQFADDATAQAPLDAFAPAEEQVTLPHDELNPGDRENFTITVPIDDLQLPETWQVYEMTIVASADTALGHVPVGRLHTFLPWAPVGLSGTGDPTRVAWVWPLVDRPHRSDGGAWMDDDLAASLAPDGRLGRLLAAGDAAVHQQPPPPPSPRHTLDGKKHRPTKQAKPKPVIQSVPITWAVDPALIDDATSMRRGYTVRTSSGTQAGSGKAAAVQWLDQLKQDVSTTEYFGVPYADPDVTAAAHAGLGSDVQYASTQGNLILGKALGPSPLPYAWPPDGFADQRTLDTFFAAGETTVVLDDAALPPIGGQPSETPSAHAQLTAQTEGFQALLSDGTLNRVVDDGAQPGADSPLDVQRLLSELLMIQAERPFDQRSLVITPDRRWDPTASYATALLADSGKVPWVDPIPLSAVAHTPVYTAVKRGLLDYPATERDLQLGRNYLSGISRIKHLVDTFTDVVAPVTTTQATTDPTVASFKDGVLRLLSTAWRTDPVLAAAASGDLSDVVQHTMNQVHIASRGSSLVTLTSHSGTVPVTVANDLDVPVQVVVKVQPDQHLVVRSGRAVQTIPPHRQLPVDIHATAQTSGVFGLTVQLTTKSGRPYGAPVPLRIRSTAYGTTALLITGGATAVLLLTVIVRLIRRARAARRDVETTA